LKAAREKRRLSIDDVVEATRIKAHIVQDLENDDYSAIAAPLYGKGFIKLYAEYVGLDPAPLVRDYLSHYAKTVRPTLKTEVPPPTPVHDGIPQPAPLARFRESSGTMMVELVNNLTTTLRDLLHSLMAAWNRIKVGTLKPTGRSMMASARGYSEMPSFSVGKTAALVVAGLVVAILAASAYYKFSAHNGPDPVVAMVHTAEVPAVKTVYTKPLRLAEPPPAPYAKLK
jgi:hypothetical protein